MHSIADKCVAIHKLLQRQKRFAFPPAFDGLPLNGVYFIFERGQVAHDCDRIVRVGSHRSENNLIARLWQHAMPYGLSQFRYDVGNALLASNGAIPQYAWDQPDAIRHASPKQNVDVANFHKFEGELSKYICAHFQFSVIPTSDAAHGLNVERLCIATIAQCGACQASAKAARNLIPISGSHLWNTQHLKGTAITDEELAGLVSLG